MRRLPIALAWLSVVAVVVAFFLPWARLDVREPSVMKAIKEAAPASEALSGLMNDVGRITAKIRRGAETVVGDLPSAADIPKEISGVQIPQLANRQDSKVAIAVLELLTNQRQNIGLKSYAVYLLPGIAILCAVVLTLLGRKAPVALGTAGLCAVVAMAGFWKLLTTRTDTLFIAITIGPGLWLSLWAYVVLSAASTLSAFPRRSPA